MRVAFAIITSLVLFAPISGMPQAPPAKELEIHLKDPHFKEGVLTTDQGGVVSAEGFRIQAEKITFINKIENGLPVKRVVAENNLLLEFAGKAFVGEKLEFDFLTHTGTLWGGKTTFDVWFIGGEKIELKSDGTYHICKAFLTTSTNSDFLWDIHAGNVSVTQKDMLTANNIFVRFNHLPIFWLPSFKANLRFFKNPPVRYKIVWDKGLGPRVTMRYRIYSWSDFNLYFRLDYRLTKGLGAALESDYFSPDGNTTFVTKSYVAKDKSVPDETGLYRYRFQGLWETQSESGKTKLHMTYDKLHDEQMVGDFKSEEFEINTQKETVLWIHHQESHAFATLRFQPRINDFQSLNQELPSILFGIKPFTLGPTGIISQNSARAAFLDYVYDNRLTGELPDRHAVRMETQNSLYRPFALGPLTCTPHAGIVAIFYNNNPERRKVGQGVITYGADLSTHLYKRYGCCTHQVTPYLSYIGLSSPITASDEVIIFNLNDGYTRLNQARFGIKNALYTTDLEPRLCLDLYANAFHEAKSFSQTVPKAYLALQYNLPRFAFFTQAAYNFQESLVDAINVRTLWTESEDFAIALEYRHRSKYDFRKASRDNFIVDAARSLNELLNSPLSDGRNTFLTHLFLRLSPRWSCHFQSHHGWGRRDEPNYNAARVELFTLLTTSWQLRISFERTTNNNSFGAGVSLVK